MARKIILTNVKEKDDIFSWSELNCFHRAFAVAFNSVNEDYYDGFLLFMSAYMSFVVNGDRLLTFDGNDSTISYFNQELEKVFGGRIVKNEFSSKRNMKEKIIQKLMTSKPMVLPCDLYELNYCKTFLEQHRRHYLVIKGIDDNKGIYHVLDNMQNNLGTDTRYSDFMVEMDTAYNMCSSFCRYFDCVSGKNYFWSVELSENKDFKKDSIIYLSKICEKILCDNANNWFENKLILRERDSNDINNYMEYINIKKLFFRLLDRFIEKNYKSDIGRKLNHRICDFIYDRDKFKIQFAINYYKNGKVENEIENKVKELIISEKSILKLTKDTFESDKIALNKPQVYEKVYRFELDDSKSYDIWNNTCEGKILLLKDENDVSGLDVNMSMDTEFGGSSHAGIIIEFVNGEKILFGSLGKMNTGIHRIGGNPEYELYMEGEPFSEVINYTIKFENKKIYFYSGKRKIYEYMHEDKISGYGIFVKTWEKCKVAVLYEIV